MMLFRSVSFTGIATALLLTGFSTGGLCAAEVEAPRNTLPSLGPEPILVPADPELRERDTSQEVQVIDRAALVQDLNGLLRIRDRVRQLMVAGEVAGIDAERAKQYIEQRRLAERSVGVSVETRKVGEPQGSAHLGLAIQRWTDETITVNATVRHERVDVVYRELLTLVGRSLDDQRVSSGSRRVSLYLQDVPWEESLTRLLGQVGLAWRLDGDKVVMYSLDREERDKEQVVRLAENAFRTAASNHDDEHAAQALYSLAQLEHQSGRYYEAGDGYLDVIQRFDRTDAEFENSRPWVRQSLRGYGEVMMELGQYRDARNLFVSYLSTSDDNDPAVPSVMYDAADASFRLSGIGTENIDATAIAQASDLWENLIQRFENHSEAREQVMQARLALGQLYFDEGKYAAAKAYLQQHNSDNRQEIGDQLIWMIAESDYNIALSESGLDQRQSAGNYFESALNGYRELSAKLLSQQIDPLADNAIYRKALFREGQCYLNRPDSDVVQALFAFLRAQSLFRDTPMEPELILHIVRCYSELERHDETVNQLFGLLSKYDNNIDPSLQLEQLLVAIDKQVAGYAGSVRSRIDFYIAQAHYRAGQRAHLPGERISRMESAMNRYKIILDSNYGASPSLLVAAQIGMARAALAVDDASQAEQILKAVIANPQSSRRDVAFSARLLGDHYRRQGRFDDAIMAYQASNVGQEQ